ncbi:uncharacterized protein LOC142322485 [Lycorma delicatula]|uniref:uncharacterized protein LOC142322485 n=1 Tax=Lycorma delicatula TaxID=130591 RepID=UPI003F517475
MATKPAVSSVLEKYGLKSLTKSNLLYHYAPAVGLSSYAVLSVNVMNPGLILRVIPNRDVTNILLLNSIVGTGLHVYNRPHLSGAPGKIRIMYCTYGSVLFSFGSVLLWALLRSILPNNKTVATILGLVSGFTLTAVGKECLDFIDSKASKTTK